MEKMKVLSLFAGVGGFDLGLERTGGFETVAFCEIDPFCQKVLAKHWPEVFIHDDVRTLTKETLWSGYAENALLNRLCKEKGGNLQYVKNAIENIRRSGGREIQESITNGPQPAEKALSIIMAENAHVAGKENTRFWQSITSIITEEKSGEFSRELHGKLLSKEDFLTTIKFFAITAIWRNQYTAPANIKSLMGECYDDVRTLTAQRLAADGIAVDVICGGFPCTQVSAAAAAHGMQLGLQGEDSGLWYEYERIIRELRPRYIIVENVTALLSGGLLDVLGGLASLGYDAEWHAIGGAHIGAPQIRDRVWIVAYAPGERTTGLITGADIEQAGQRWQSCQADLHTLYDTPFEQRDSRPAALFRGVDDRPANWVDRVKACGNAVMPDFPEMIGRAIVRDIASW